jgi:pentatricopeptide repeat protein
MSSHYAAPSILLVASLVQSASLDSPLFFGNSYRSSHYKRTQHGKLVVTATLSLSSTNPTEHAGVHSINLVDSNDRFQIKDIIDSISGLPKKERTEFLSTYVKDREFRTISDFNDLVMALFVAEEPDLALKLFSDMSSYGLEPDSWTFSIVSRCYCKKNHLDEAKRVLDQMVEEKGFHPDVATVTILINGFCKRGRLQRAFEVFDFMGRIGCKPTVQTYNCLLKGLCYVGRVEEAFEMLIKIKKDSMKPDIYTYTAVMDGFCKVGRSDEAVELLNEAVEMGLTPNVVTYNTLFNGFCKEGRPLEGIGVLKQMKQRNCMPDYISYSTLLHGLLKWGKIRSALRTYKEMVGDGFEADERMMNTLLRGLCRRSWKEKDLLEDAYQLFEKMKNGFYVIDLSTYGLMIKALCVGEKIGEALDNLHDLTRMGHSPHIITFNSVIRALCAEGRVDEALLVLILMDEGRRIPNRISYNLLIEECNRRKWLLGACNIYGAALKRGVIPDRKPRSSEVDSLAHELML